jgi:hypothetical protein
MSRRSMSEWADTSRPTSRTGPAQLCQSSRGRTHEDHQATSRARRRGGGLRDGRCGRRIGEGHRKGKLGFEAVAHLRDEGEGGSPGAATGAPTGRCSYVRTSFVACYPRRASLLSPGRRSSALLRRRGRALSGNGRRRGVLGRLGAVDGLLRCRPLKRKSKRDEVLPDRGDRGRPSLERRCSRSERRCRRPRAGRRQCLRHVCPARCSRAWPRRTG